MKVNLKARILLLLVGCLMTFPATPGEAATTTYRFTGRVTDSDLYRPFTVDLGVVPGLEVGIGDSVTGTMKIYANPSAFPPGIYGPGTGTYASLNSLSLMINGTELSAGRAPTWTIVANDVSQSDSSLLEGGQLAESGDAYVLVVSSQDTRGVLVNGAAVPPADYVSIQLSLTDSTGTVFQNAQHPIQVDPQNFDLRKGFITRRTFSQTEVTYRGILFSIDTLRIVGSDDTNGPPVIITPAIPVPTLTTGFHVSWPSSADGYVLEVADSAEGPWIRSEATPVVADGRNIAVMAMQGRSRLYRLTKAD